MSKLSPFSSLKLISAILFFAIHSNAQYFKPVNRTHVFTNPQGSLSRIFLYTKDYNLARSKDFKANDTKISHLRLSEHFIIAYVPFETFWLVMGLVPKFRFRFRQNF